MFGRMIASVLLTIFCIAFSSVSCAGSSSEPMLIYLEKVAELEAQNGFYETWEISEKQELVKAMEQIGIVTEGSLSTEMEIDTLVMQRYSIENRIDLVTFHRIASIEKGPISVWNGDDKAWYSSLRMRLGYVNDEYIFLLPEETVISPQEAILLAQEAARSDFHLSQTDIEDNYVARWAYQVHSELYGVVEPEYLIEFVPQQDKETLWYYVSNHGVVSTDMELPVAYPFYDKEAETLFSEYVSLHQDQLDNLNLGAWPLEHKKYFSDHIAPVILENSAGIEESYMMIDYLAAAQYKYGLPENDSIKEGDALAIAKEAIKGRYNLADPELNLYSVIFNYFDITDPDRPLWKFTFQYNKRERGELSKDAREKIYVVSVEANTGHLSEIDCFSKSENDGSLSYRVKLY